ncbi:MAG: hypothetical protein ACREBD_27995 [Blastocatellia bacterium]
MLIANPIYDTVFKYLLEDNELAREFLATILDEEIISIEVKPQETVTESADYGVNIFRLDFKAVIKMVAGEHRKVLIELQKAKRLLDIMRFRRYLAAHRVTDVLTGKIISPRPREPFVELLNHESYTVQIPLLTETARTRLEGALMVFNQEHQTDNPHVLNFTGDLSDPLVKKMVDRLARAISDPQVRREMDAEDEVDRTITRLLHEKELEYQAALQEKEAALQEKEAALQEKDAALQEKDRMIADLMKQLTSQQE